MQSDFSYIQGGKSYVAKLWTEQEEAKQQAQALATETTQSHELRAVGEAGWICVGKESGWVDANNTVLEPPRQFLQYQLLRQAVRDCRVRLEIEYNNALSQIRRSWVALNPRRLAEPNDVDYTNEALLTVFLLDSPESITLSVEQGVQLLFEQEFSIIPQGGKVEKLSSNLTSWWKKNVVTTA